MKQTVIALTLLLISSSFSLNAQKGQEKLIEKSFESYRNSILNDRGEDAVKFVDSRTIKYYGDMLHLVKNADSVQIETLNLMDKLMVFAIRHRASREAILSFDGEGLLVYAIESGMVGKNTVANNTIGEITVDSTFATAQYIANGRTTPFYFHFYKEGEVATWKVDLTSLFPPAILAFKQLAKDSGQDENEFLFSLLEMISGTTPDAEIWKPVR